MGHAACTNYDVRILRYHLFAWIMRVVEGRDFKLIELCRQTEFLIVRFQGYFSGREWKFPLSAGNKTKTRTKLFWNSVVNKFKQQIFILLHLYYSWIIHCLTYLQPLNLCRNSQSYCQLKQLFFQSRLPQVHLSINSTYLRYRFQSTSYTSKVLLHIKYFRLPLSVL